MASPLSDLDELILKCRDEKAKSYIREAVSCYKSGAFRSAIVSTWIAVVFDIIDKLRELSLAGDREAENQINEFEKARDSGDISKSLKFEREIMAVCRDKLELISHLEYIDLYRLQQDRNRCAHPSMTSDSEIFNPSAELARVHIRSAVEYLLQFPPAQGKSAMVILLKEVDSEYFPTEQIKAVTVFKNSPLLKARKSLVRNFIIVLLKKLLGKPKDYKEVLKISSALNATESLHKDVYDEVLKDKLSSLMRAINDIDLENTLPVFQMLAESWEFLDEDVQQKIKKFVKNLPVKNFDSAEFLLIHTGLSESVKYRIRIATRKEIDEPIFFSLPKEVGERIVKLFVGSETYDHANSFASTVQKYATDFLPEQVEKIVRGCGVNDQISGSFVVGIVISSLRRNKSVSDKSINSWLSEVGLKKFMKNDPFAPQG